MEKQKVNSGSEQEIYRPPSRSSNLARISGLYYINP